ncbi:MAG: CYTH and CHAD domain-containing protein [Rubrivivax sp.]|nr:CYTH and CHAD domain-containing protein [Rubrivivax sp.]
MGHSDIVPRVAMVETELKFQVPPETRAAARRALATTRARSVSLRAKYFDTPDRRLAAAGLALRLRKEGRQWVQTLKGPGASALQRIEHEIPLGQARGEPQLDVARHAGTPAGEALAAALGDSAGSLQLVFETKVRRTHRLVRSAGALVEVAFDCGEIIAGRAGVESQRAPLCEIEFELVRGPVEGLLALAARWVERHRLWLDVRSKAERGERLARGVEAGPAVQASQPPLEPHMSADAALRHIIGTCLAQVLPNAADVAAGVGGAEHLHQLRIGLRRLRCALRVFGDASPAADAGWAPALAALFARLGAARDRDAIAESVLPELRRAGAPLAELPADGSGDDPGDALRGVACTRLLLELIGFSHPATEPDAGLSRRRAAPSRLKPQGPRRGPCRAMGAANAVSVGAPSTGPPQPDIVSLVKPRLRRMRRQLEADAAAFMTLDDTARHRTRRRLKRLRYSLEFVAALFPAGAVKRCLARVRPAQEVLGRYNDLAVAEQAFRMQTAQDPRAWFAVGWLSARRAQLVPQATRALVRLARTPDVWRKRK